MRPCHSLRNVATVLSSSQEKSPHRTNVLGVRLSSPRRWVYLSINRLRRNDASAISGTPITLAEAPHRQSEGRLSVHCPVPVNDAASPPSASAHRAARDREFRVRRGAVRRGQNSGKPIELSLQLASLLFVGVFLMAVRRGQKCWGQIFGSPDRLRLEVLLFVGVPANSKYVLRLLDLEHTKAAVLNSDN